ncbi:receptor-like protein EIX1 [Prosopis cineraria]|uniref:receptor-like protein EIX1 n=1 Tax=Prosopis cineraria TaxID=364024 RepID=UPI00240FC4F7|nr:receptor-like protein EIX1 [Prosopis cineraria]
MSSLKVLSLDSNRLQGEIPPSLANICTLEELELSFNDLSGELLSFVSNASWCNGHSLKQLSLSSNQLTGILPNLSVFLSLQYMDLSDNNLKGKILESHFKNLSNLMYLSLSDNSLTLEINNSWVPPFQLQSLGMASCEVGPDFPNWIRNQYQLMTLDISNGGLLGFIPEWFWPLMKYVYHLNISYNNFFGEIPNLPLKFYNRPMIILTSNNFEGSIPSFFIQATRLELSKNKFSNLVPLLCGQTDGKSFSIFDASDNQLKGHLPNCWSHLNSLKFVDLSNNNLSGEIPHSIGDLVNMEALILKNNRLIGELPSSLMSCTNLLLLDMSENKLLGLIPSWIGKSLGELQILSLRKNNFYGSLPLNLCHLTQIGLLDLSCNNLSNKIPSCLHNFTVMAQQHINSTKSSYHMYRINTTRFGFSVDKFEFYITLMWKGEDMSFKKPDVLLKSIDLSSNAFTGEIPKEVVYLLGLVSLNLSRNKLKGKIPIEIGNLEYLEFLDLSRNKLSGTIPLSLAHIDRLSVLDLSNNNLFGKIPTGTQLQGFNASCYERNLDLCGMPLNKKCLEDSMPSPQIFDHPEDDGDSLFSQQFYLSLGIGFAIGFWAFMGPLLFNRSWRQTYYRFVNDVTNRIHVMIIIYVTRYHARN